MELKLYYLVTCANTWYQKLTSDLDDAKKYAERFVREHGGAEIVEIVIDYKSVRQILHASPGEVVYTEVKEGE